MRTCVLLHVSSVQPRLGKGCCRRHFWLFQEIPHFTSTGKIHSHSHLQWQIQATGPGGPGPPLFLNQTKTRRAQKMFLETAPPFSKGLDDRAPLPPYLRVWMPGPPSPLISGSGWPGPPPPLSQGLDDRVPLPPYLRVWIRHWFGRRPGDGLFSSWKIFFSFYFSTFSLTRS